MKLYSKFHVVKISLLTAIFAIAITSFVHQKILPQIKTNTQQNISSNSFTQNELETTSEVPEIEEVLQELIKSPLPVINDTTSYTQDEAQNIAVYEHCNEAVVNITTQVMGYDWFLEPYMAESGSGSGSIIDKRGYIVTNVHVIENASVINVSLADGSTFEGKVIGQDKESDIAVIKFDPPKNIELKTIAFGDSSKLKVGQKVIAIGNPFAQERTMTTGIISGLGRPIQRTQDDVILRNMIQTDAAINPGNSGGPLLDSQGRMIGINTLIMSPSGSSSGVGFAIPASTARRVVSDLLEFGKVNRGIMKISLVQNTSRVAKYVGYGISNGMVISKVLKNSQAEKAGLKTGTIEAKQGSYNPQTVYLGGDIIVAIDKISVNTLQEYYSALEDKRPGDIITVTVYRNGEYKKINVTLEENKPSSTKTTSRSI